MDSTPLNKKFSLIVPIVGLGLNINVDEIIWLSRRTPAGSTLLTEVVTTQGARIW